MSLFGIIITSFWITSSVLLLVFAKWVRKLLKYELFWKIFSLVVFGYIFYFRYILDFQEYLKGVGFKQTIFLTDFCVFAGVIVPFLIFFKKLREFFSPIAIWLIIASGVTSYEIALSKPDNGGFFKWVFEGGWFNNYNNFARLHVSMHYLTFIIGILLLINTNFQKLNINYLLKNILMMGFYLTYAFVMSKIVNLDQNVTGLVKGDWFGGQYEKATEVLQKIWPNKLTWPTVLFLGFGILLASDIFFVCLFWITSKVIINKKKKRARTFLE